MALRRRSLLISSVDSSVLLPTTGSTFAVEVDLGGDSAICTGASPSSTLSPSSLPSTCATGRVTDFANNGAAIPNFPVVINCYLGQEIVYTKQLITDANGEYKFPNVPEGYECEVSVDVEADLIGVDVNVEEETATCLRV
ncbi:hypothetical protein SARC_03630 [Sphaeroforma arctica JP610]|uniref:SD-repeat containing protein B domain-containing protein n=1 Tax=Sphaeroforma arctica JP610 TaxID=667725 RepID=A0A0L0G7F9_9EUKA|nr:hypothetical protein SARC_03630 [Sphaeroforma arctica JP610]KNC84148.1 hypothetical protein SARC_03630 [Sphaeroforma arctica JP610]|eukprot:XP_014158050.1 hypothetical protein SARC_03630 [Sphaeroforma arctica JP610]